MSSKLTFEHVKDLLTKFNGNQKAAAEAAGVTRQAISKWVRKYPELREIRQAYIDGISDVVVDQFAEAVLEGDKSARWTWAQLYLKKPEVVVNNISADTDQKPLHDFLTPDELREISEIMDRDKNGLALPSDKQRLDELQDAAHERREGQGNG